MAFDAIRDDNKKLGECREIARPAMSCNIFWKCARTIDVNKDSSAQVEGQDQLGLELCSVL